MKSKEAEGTPSEIFAALVGEWRLKRSILPSGRFEGTARFDRVDASTLRYREEGVLSLPDTADILGTREYIYRLEGDSLCAYFPEDPPRLFHCFALTSDPSHAAVVGDATHQCNTDLYSSHYVFRPDGTFRITHQVKGDRKDYVLETEYERTRS